MDELKKTILNSRKNTLVELKRINPTMEEIDNVLTDIADNQA